MSRFMWDMTTSTYVGKWISNTSIKINNTPNYQFKLKIVEIIMN